MADSSVVVNRSFRDDSVLTSGARCDILPDDLSEVAKSELALTVADDSTVRGAGAGTVGIGRPRSGGRRSSDCCKRGAAA